MRAEFEEGSHHVFSSSSCRVPFALQPILASSSSSSRDSNGPIPPYTIDTTPMLEQLAMLPFEKMSVKREAGKERLLLAPEPGGFSNNSERT